MKCYILSIEKYVNSYEKLIVKLIKFFLFMKMLFCFMINFKFYIYKIFLFILLKKKNFIELLFEI